LSNVVEVCSLPLTSARPVGLLVGELETAPGVSVQQVLTEAELVVPSKVPEMAI
jgi:hypothetical protein